MEDEEKRRRGVFEEECFNLQKENAMKLLPEMYIDPKIRDLIKTLNEMEQTWTTSSCQGHLWREEDKERLALLVGEDTERFAAIDDEIYGPEQSPYVNGITRIKDLLKILKCAKPANLKLEVESPRWEKGYGPTTLAARECRNGRMPKDTLEWYLAPTKLEGLQTDQAKFRTFQKCLSAPSTGR